MSCGPGGRGGMHTDQSKPVPRGLNDSKKLTERQRKEIDEELRQTAVAYSLGIIDADEIDRVNILEATKLAMLKAIAGLTPAADHLLIDALQLRQCSLPQKAIIKGGFDLIFDRRRIGHCESISRRSDETIRC